MAPTLHLKDIPQHIQDLLREKGVLPPDKNLIASLVTATAILDLTAKMQIAVAQIGRAGTPVAGDLYRVAANILRDTAKELDAKSGNDQV